VNKVFVSFKDKSAVVTYDDAKADLSELTRATTNAEYPSARRVEAMRDRTKPYRRRAGQDRTHG
jgi:hypothetical protein